MSQATSIRLPAAVARYVDATNSQDAAAVAGCFVAGGTVRDEGTVQRGAAEIIAWADETAARYQSTIEPRDIVEADGHWRLQASVAGNFPGSPALLVFDFVLQPEGIASLEISA